MKFKTEGIVKIDRREDSGQAVIAEPIVIDTPSSDEENGLMVRLTSWDVNSKHVDMNKLIGKKIKITIETIDETPTRRFTPGGTGRFNAEGNEII